MHKLHPRFCKALTFWLPKKQIGLGFIYFNKMCIWSQRIVHESIAESTNFLSGPQW